MHRAVEYHLLRTTDELSDFASEWQRLFWRDPRAIPFQSAEWLLPWWRQFGNEELCAVVMERGGEAIGLLPFYVYGDVAKRQRQLLPLGVGTADYLDGVFAPECSLSEIGRAVEFLRHEVEHDVLCVPQLREHSRLFQAWKQTGTELYLSHSDACSRMGAVRIADLPQKIRRNAMYYRNRAQRLGKLELVRKSGNRLGAVFLTRCGDCTRPAGRSREKRRRSPGMNAFCVGIAKRFQRCSKQDCCG